MEYDELGREWIALLTDQSEVEGAREWEFLRVDTESKWYCWRGSGRSGLLGDVGSG